MTPDIKAIKAAAEAAKSIKWVAGHVYLCNSEQTGHLDALLHIATANPATVIALCDEVESLRKDAARYQWLAWKSDTTPIMPYDCENDRFYFGYECDAAIDAAMESKL